MMYLTRHRSNVDKMVAVNRQQATVYLSQPALQSINVHLEQVGKHIFINTSKLNMKVKDMNVIFVNIGPS